MKTVKVVTISNLTRMCARQVAAQVIMTVGMQLYGIVVNRFAMLYAPVRCIALRV